MFYICTKVTSFFAIVLALLFLTACGQESNRRTLKKKKVSGSEVKVQNSQDSLSAKKQSELDETMAPFIEQLVNDEVSKKLDAKEKKGFGKKSPFANFFGADKFQPDEFQKKIEELNFTPGDFAAIDIEKIQQDVKEQLDEARKMLEDSKAQFARRCEEFQSSDFTPFSSFNNTNKNFQGKGSEKFNEGLENFQKQLEEFQSKMPNFQDQIKKSCDSMSSLDFDSITSFIDPQEIAEQLQNSMKGFQN